MGEGMAENVSLVMMSGGWSDRPLERELRQACQASARDLLSRLLSTGVIDQAVIATDDAEWADRIEGSSLTISVDLRGEAFHFGRRLAALIKRRGWRRVLYTGGAAAPLMQTHHWRDVLERLCRADRLMMANNLHSSDWVGLTVDERTLALIAEVPSDNALAWVLANDAGLPAEDLPAAARTRFDLDTPLDLLIARHHPHIGPALRRRLDRLDWEAPALDGLLEVMVQEGASLAVIGRVSSSAWRALEQATRCWVRVFAEERGMQASGRLTRGEVRSLVADYLRLVGLDRFFEALAGLADGVFLDSRVIMAACGEWPAAEDRFNADLLRWREIQSPFLRQLTRAAAEAPVPVVMGGHSIVSGGLMTLVDSLRSEEGMG